ncbi:LPD38 domain-containing protein [Aeromonas jandaei]|uniref:LPD38 domain-containing protein n=1 Tax=Aeromonas jandaei TaxID=650 RepID=UPI001F016CD5|nr:LPD38 domain-containing protein [Aeromonas jandaei]
MAQFTREDFMRDAMERYGSRQQPDPQSDEQGIIMDGIDMFQRGLGQTLGGDLEAVGQITDSQGIKDAGRGVSAWADGQLQEVSTPMREAMGKQFFQENADTGAIEAGDAWADPRAWAGNFSSVLGQFVGLVGGTKGAGLLARPALRGAGKLLAKDLVEGKAREMVAKATVKDAIQSGALDSTRAAYLTAPSEAAKRAVLDQAIGRLTSIGYGAHAGAMASGMRAQQAEQEARGFLNGLGNDELNANPIYQQAYWDLADGDMQGASVGDIRRAAIDSIAEKAATDAWADPRAMAADFLSGVLTGAGGGVGGALGKIGTTRAGAAVRGFVGEGATEAWQGGETQRAVNQAVQEWADETRDPMAGVLSSALNEGTIGGVFGGVVGGVHGPETQAASKPVVRVERRVVTGDEQMDDMIHGLDQRQAERGASISGEIDSIFANSRSKLMPGQSDPAMDIPAYQRMAEQSAADVVDPAATPVIEQQADTAAAQLATPIQQADMPAFRQVDPIEETPAFLRQSIARAGSETDSVFGPLKTMRVTKRGKPFASEKEAAMASRNGAEMPVPLNGGGFGIADIAEVEQARGDQATAVPQDAGQEVRDNTELQPLAQAVDTGYREIIPATQLQAEVTNEQAPQVLAVGSEGQGDQLGAGVPAAAGAEPAIAGLTDRAGPGDPTDYAAAPPVPDGLQQNDQTLTAPAPDAGVAVSEVAQPEPVASEPAAAPMPWSEAIDNPDGTITLKGEVPLIKQWAKESGVKAIPGKGGMVVAKSSAAKVREYAAPAVSEPVQQIEAARAEVAPEPTEAQKEAGNYKKGHLTLHGMDIALENPKGSTRSGIDSDGKAWQSTMAHDYGYIKRTTGADGDHVDVFIGDQPDSETVYVVDQVDPKTGKFDEHKVMMGFADEKAALDGYLANYEKGWKGLSAIKAMPVEEFKRWVKEGDTTKPIADAAPDQEEGRGNAQDDKPVKEPERSISFSKQAMAQGDKPAKHLARKEAEMVTKEWFKQYRGASGIDVQIHATQAELEKALGLAAKDGLIRRAAFDDDTGTLHVAADTIANPKRMREILRHEVLAHYGLANVLGDGEYTKLISRLIKSKKDPSMKAVWEWVDTHYADEDIGVQAEEVIAHLAELEPSAWRRGWDTVVAWVTKALRMVGFAPDGITAAETRNLIEALGKKMRRADGGVVTAEGDRLWFSAERSPWGKDFPEVILHGRLTDATGHPDYAAAKGGDDAAARRLVSDVLSPDAIRQLKKVIGNREAIALGVHAEEAVSRNAIPQAMADVLGKVLGIEVSVDIVQAAKVGRTTQDGFGRLANQPSFDGEVRTDKPYLIMDDTLTQGGTLANLKGYIENRGGEVLAATALTGKQYSAKIAIDSSTLEQLRDQYDGTGLEAWWHNRFGYGFDSLTESEGRYLLRAKDADKVRDRVTAAGYAAPARGEHESARDDGSLPPDGLKFSQSNTAADDALQKLNLGPKPDIIDKTKTNLDKLRKVERSVVKSWLDRFIKKANTEVLDALAPIKYAEDAAGITDAADSGYVAARMATGAASTMQATMLYGLPEWKDGVIQKKADTGEKDALLGIFSDLGSDLHNWLGWMAGHRAELLMDQGRENLLSEQDIAALKGLGKGKETKFNEAKARWNRLNAATLDLAQEAGLFTKEARSEFESEWYIPFFRESEDGDVLAPFKPKGIANQNAGIKKLKGGEANTADLLENIFTSTSKLIDASMKNMAAQKTIWNLADTGIIEVVAKPNMMDWRALKNGKNLITVKIEGEDYMIKVEDPDLYRAMTFFDRQPFGTMVNVAAKAKRLLTAGVTASPEFMLRNFLRDSLSSWAISKDGFKPVIDSIKGVKKTLAMEGSTIDVMFSGASFLGGYVNGNDPGAMADSVRKSLRRKGMTPEQIAKYEKSIVRNAAQVKGIVADVWDKYSRYGEALENANREAVYDAAIKAGKSHAQAAFESKDLMDFSMLGAARFIQGASMVLPFFNARIQGLGKLSRELRDNPREIAKRAGMITAMSLGLLAMNWDDERYDELPDWDKDSNWHFFIGDQHFRIPKPFEIGVMFGTIPERMVRAFGGKDTGEQFGKAVARALGDTFALNPTPQIVKPLVESYFNYDTFSGGPIENAQDLAVKAEARYNEQTSLMMRELGEAMGMSPKKLEHLLIGYTGTIGGYVMAAADGLIRASQPGESASWRADEIPLVKAVYRGTGPATSTQHMEQFYQMLNEVNQLKRTVDQYRSEGLTDKAKELLDEQGRILRSRSSLSRTQQQIRVLRNNIELLQRDKVLSADEKRRRIDALLARRNDLVYRAVTNNLKNWE